MSFLTTRGKRNQETLQRSDAFCHCLRRLHHCSFFTIVKLYFDDLLHSLCTEFYGNTEVEITQTVFSFEIGRTRENTVLVFNDRLHHLDHCGPGA